MAPHPLGQASLAIDPAKSVFINCPFDTDFAGKFEAIVFTIVCCGFTPRCAHEGVQAEGRVTRILQPLFSSHYSIHDLSRCKGEGDENYARFNMPLELGMAMARRYQIEQTNSTAKKKVQTYFPHEWLVLVPQGHNSRRYISDLGAFDLKEHDGNKETIVVRVLSWLRFKAGTMPMTPDKVLPALKQFEDALADLKIQYKNDPGWPDIIETAKNNAPK